MLEMINALLVMIAQRFGELTAAQHMFCALVGAFIFGNLILYFFTRGKEFAVSGYSAVLFLIPFVQFS